MLIPNSLFCGPYLDKTFDLMNKLIDEHPGILIFTSGGDVTSYFVLRSDLSEEIMQKLEAIDREAEKEAKEWDPP